MKVIPGVVQGRIVTEIGKMRSAADDVQIFTRTGRIPLSRMNFQDSRDAGATCRGGAPDSLIDAFPREGVTVCWPSRFARSPHPG
jgi:hypothetical protein